MRLNTAIKERIRLRYRAGFAVWQIAEEFGLTIPQVTRILGI